MAGFDLTPERLAKSVYTDRFAALARADVDLATWKTWDKLLVREKRILVPVDVQAYVVPVGGQEACVDVAGVDGDPAPFDAGAVRPAGVHLHWALPATHVGGSLDAAEYALQLLRFPYRQVFGDPRGVSIGTVFKASVVYAKQVNDTFKLGGV